MLTKADKLEWEVHEALSTGGKIDVPVEMPWGERITLREGGARTYEFPLDEREARAMRVLRVCGLFAAIVTYIRGR